MKTSPDLKKKDLPLPFSFLLTERFQRVFKVWSTLEISVEYEHKSS